MELELHENTEGVEVPRYVSACILKENLETNAGRNRVTRLAVEILKQVALAESRVA